MATLLPMAFYAYADIDYCMHTYELTYVRVKMFLAINTEL